MLAARLLCRFDNLASALAVVRFQDNEDDAIQNKHGGNGIGVIEMVVNPVVQGKTQNRSRNTADNNHAPHVPCVAALGFVLCTRNGIQLMPEGNHNRHDGTNLDDHQKQLQELIAYIELHEFVDQNHMTCRGNREPFGDALGDTE